MSSDWDHDHRRPSIIGLLIWMWLIAAIIYLIWK